MKTHKTIMVDGLIYQYTLQIKKVKNLILKIEQNGELVVSANAYIPQSKIDSFISEKITWIIQKQGQKQAQYERLYTNCLEQDIFFYFDKALKIVLVQSNKDDVAMDDEYLYIYYRHEREDCLKTMNKFIKRICQQKFREIVDKYLVCLQDYHLKDPIIKYRYMKSRWGSCATNRNTITLNLYLLHYPYAFAEYVVLHELVHFIQPNHSKHFYQIIEYQMPDYKSRIKLSQI